MFRLSVRQKRHGNLGQKDGCERRNRLDCARARANEKRLASATSSRAQRQRHDKPLWEILKERQPTKALILLGVHDYIGKTIEKGMDYDTRIIDLAQKHAPNTELIFLSLTPVTKSFCKHQDYRTMWDEYNAALKGLCLLRNVPYIDIASPMKDEEGYLKSSYASDGKYHLKYEALELWVQALLDYAQSQYDQGLWTPEDTP